MTMKRTITVTVNGERHHSEVEPRLLLVHYLREALDLTGTHVGCNTSQCGACVVHLNGEAIKSCTLLAVQADGGEITTIEGIGTEESLHPQPKLRSAKALRVTSVAAPAIRTS
jgi:carbon-monoxide dehydrogenase small subunit